MIFVLFLGVLLLLILSYFLFFRNMLNPSVILCSVFLVCILFTMINAKKWGIDYSIKGVLIIWGTIASFIIGNSVVLIFQKKITITKQHFKKIHPPSFYTVMLINMVLVYFLFEYFKASYELSLLGGNPGGYGRMIFYIREATLNFYTVGRLKSLSGLITCSVAYILYFSFVYISILEGINWKKIYLLSPMLIYFGFMVLSAARTPFIYCFVYCLLTFCVVYQWKNNFSPKTNKKIILYGGVTLILFFIVFLLVGSLKTSSQGHFFRKISIYTGSSLAAFNEFLNKNIPENTYWGQNTLFKIYNIIRTFNNKIPKFYAPYEFIYFNNGERTNIYSAMRRFIQDFGLTGLFSITLILGIIYGLFFHYVCYKKKLFYLILYSSLCYPIFEFPIEERFFMYIFPNEIIYYSIFFGVTYYFLIHRISSKKEIKNDTNNRS